MSSPFTIDSEEANPFADHQAAAAPSRWTPSERPQQQAPPPQPSYTSYPSAQLSHGSNGNLATREAELVRREAALNQREKQLDVREASMGDYNPPNFPPCKPMVYHDIEKDIPDEGKPLVKRLYLAWIFSVFNFLINAITGFLLITQKAESAGGNFGSALIMLLAITPVSFVFWYQPVYNGVKNKRSIQFFLFQVNYCFHIGLCGLLSAGIPGWGGAGIIYAMSEIGSNVGIGVMCAITAAGFIWQVVYGLWQLKSVRSYYQARGMNAEEAKQQAIAGVAQSSLGREIAKTAVKSAIASQV
ncbi:scamp family-domain-containing protein [Chytriomyces sp. MP71]|nr:scamp family-domain-containing protein [Chytriomyces sp. MP71]